MAEARQFNGTNCIELLAWMGIADWDNPELHTTDHPIVHSRDGEHCTKIGDWIVKDIQGEFYLMDPETFESIAVRFKPA